MIIEVMYADLMLHGDKENVEYLKKNLPSAKFVYTSISDTPYFVSHDINVLMMGSLTENNQKLAINACTKYKNRIKSLLENNCMFLIFGNSIEIFGKYIEENNVKTTCLDIFNYYTLRNLEERKQYSYLGTFENIKILGFISTFDKIINNENHFSKKSNCEIYEGFKYKNFYGTELHGPFLILNPLFTKKILKMINQNFNKLYYEDEIINAYKVRLKELENIL